GQAQNGTSTHNMRHQAQKPRSVDNPVLLSRCFCSGILTGKRSTVPEILDYESKCLGDFSKRISSVIMLRPGGSEYPIWAIQGGAPGRLRPPAWPSCSASPPFGPPAA